MDVLIAGAGICGLTAAIALRHQGHRVKLFEQSRLAAESGAAIFLPPNANGPLRAYGFKAEDHGANRYQKTLHFTQDGKLDLTETFSGDEFPFRWDLIRRSSLHSGLKDLALDPNGSGPAAELHTASRVAYFDAEKALIRLENGAEFRGDVILGADGSHSLARECVGAVGSDGSPIEPFASGKNCFRFLIDRARLKADAQTREVYSNEGSMVAWFGAENHLVSYPCQNNEVINFVAIHPAHLSDARNKDYDSAGSKENLQRLYEDFEPTVQTIMRLVDADSVKLYPLNDMGRLPTYVKGRLALLGDAAHPFLPYLGQGGAQAIEDGISIGVLLSADIKAEDVPARLKLYEKARKQRAESVQHETRLTGSGLADAESLDFNALRKANFVHDEVEHSKQILREYMSSAAG